MKKMPMHAELLFMPVDIKEIFFSDVSIKFSPTKEDTPQVIDNKDIAFSSFIAVLNEADKMVQVSVRFFTTNPSKHISFSISCVGIYKWLEEEFGEPEIKNIYSWGVSVQTSMVRERITKELLNSPYHEKLYLPIGLVQIKDDLAP